MGVFFVTKCLFNGNDFKEALAVVLNATIFISPKVVFKIVHVPGKNFILHFDFTIFDETFCTLS